MANTYTPKLNLAKPAHGDVDWHIPINENWDKIDTELDKALKISGTTIDADKNWNNKSITNLHHIEVTTIRPEASDEIRWGPHGGAADFSVTIPSVYITGTARIVATHTPKAYAGDSGYYYRGIGNIRINGITVASWKSGTHNEVYALKGGDVVSFVRVQEYAGGGQYGIGTFSNLSICLTDTVPVIRPTPPTWPE